MDIVVLLFDRMTALDAVGPVDVLKCLPGARLTFVAPGPGPIRTSTGGLVLHAEHDIEAVHRADLLLVPGGHGTRALLDDQRVLAWIRDLDRTTTWTTSVCTGSLVLAAAGLLAGREATTHWSTRTDLVALGARPVAQRVVFDGKYATAAGVSAGIDLGLQLAGRIAGELVAQSIQLRIEYDPEPPWDAGSLEKAPAAVVELATAQLLAD
jgi:putative intracellular protease/amidase